LQVNNGSEHAALEATAREFGEEAFDRVEPGCGGRGEVERPAGMPGQPLALLRSSSEQLGDYGPFRSLIRGDARMDQLSFASLDYAAKNGAQVFALLALANLSLPAGHLRPLDEVAGRMPPAAGANKESSTTSATLLRLSPFDREDDVVQRFLK
jgi:hypothetical protein